MHYIYGFAADPITKAHIEIIKKVKKLLKDGDELIIAVTNNDEKEYGACINSRMMLVCASLKGMLGKNVKVVEQAYRMYQFLRQDVKSEDDKDYTIVIGGDEWKSLKAGEWVHSDLLLKNFNFLVFTRNEDNLVEHLDNVQIMKLDLPDCSSSKVRRIFDRNPETHYDEVNDCLTHKAFREIKDWGLYHQNKPEYDKEELKFLQEYAKKKEENHWGEPSVTTDTIAWNGDEILLIRRKKPPFQNYWALPGGFFEKTDEDLAYGAARELKEETGLNYDPEKFQQIKAYGHNFDPRMKIVDVAFAVRISKQDMKLAKGDDDAAEARWFNVNALPHLAFHHAQIINDWANKTGRWDG